MAHTLCMKIKVLIKIFKAVGYFNSQVLANLKLFQKVLQVIQAVLHQQVQMRVIQLAKQIQVQLLLIKIIQVLVLSKVILCLLNQTWIHFKTKIILNRCMRLMKESKALELS